jgi:hypothetical protein
VKPSKSLTVATTVAALVGCIGLSATVVSYAAGSASSSHHSKRPMVMTGPTGNKVEMVDPDHSTYVPKIRSASDKDRAYAKKVLGGVNKFCANHTVAQPDPSVQPGAFPGRPPREPDRSPDLRRQGRR